MRDYLRSIPLVEIKFILVTSACACGDNNNNNNNNT